MQTSSKCVYDATILDVVEKEPTTLLLTGTSFHCQCKAFRQLLSNYHQDNRGALAAYALLEGGDHAENLLDDLVTSRPRSSPR